MLQNARVAAFSVSELLRETRGGKITSPPPPPFLLRKPTGEVKLRPHPPTPTILIYLYGKISQKTNNKSINELFLSEALTSQFL